jgi:hypothetical protein
MEIAASKACQQHHHDAGARAARISTAASQQKVGHHDGIQEQMGDIFHLPDRYTQFQI